MLGVALATLLATAAGSSPPREEPPVQFALGFGLGFDYDLLGLQLDLRIHHVELFSGLGVGVLFGTVIGGVRYVADTAPGWTFIAAIDGGSYYQHAGPSNEFGPDESIYLVGSSVGARWNWQSGWFGQVGAGPALLVTDCRDGRRCALGTHVKPSATLDLGFGFTF